MAKIGTAHVEIKPVLNDDELTSICRVIEEATAAAVRRGIAQGFEDGPLEGVGVT